jgi:uncharacterized protein YuzE
MRVTYDAQADAVFIYLIEIPPGGVERSALFNREMSMGSVHAAFSADGELVGIEVLGARKYVPQEVLDQAERIG